METTLYVNGKFATNATPYFAEAVAVSDGRIAACRDNGTSAQKASGC